MDDVVARPGLVDRPVPRDLTLTIDEGVSFHIRAWDPVRLPGPGREPVSFVLLHGIAATARSWDAAGRLLAASGHRAFALDFRGHGRSADGTAPFGVPEFARDVAAAIAALDLGRPIVAGHSLGGDVAVDLAATLPELVGGVVLVDGGIAGGDSQFDTWEACQKEIVLRPIAGMPRHAVEGFMRASHPEWSEERLQSMMAAFAVHADGTVEWRISEDAFSSLLRSLWVEPLRRKWPRIEAPVLALMVDTGDPRWTAGKRDALGRAYSSGGIARLHVEWLTGDHEIHAACPDAVVSLILDWLRHIGID